MRGPSPSWADRIHPSSLSKTRGAMLCSRSYSYAARTHSCARAARALRVAGGAGASRSESRFIDLPGTDKNWWVGGEAVNLPRAVHVILGFCHSFVYKSPTSRAGQYRGRRAGPYEHCTRGVQEMGLGAGTCRVRVVLDLMMGSLRRMPTMENNPYPSQRQRRRGRRHRRCPLRRTRATGRCRERLGAALWVVECIGRSAA